MSTPEPAHDGLTSQSPSLECPSLESPGLESPGLESPGLESLSLEELRGYRQRLRDEEDRVSYWRRLVHARMDLLTAGRSTDGSITVEELVRVLGDTGTGATRTALLRVRAAAPLPDVPDLTEVWVAPGTEQEAAAQLSALEHAEQQLTGYRTGLFARIDAAGVELVRRYHADPTLALSVLG